MDKYQAIAELKEELRQLADIEYLRSLGAFDSFQGEE